MLALKEFVSGEKIRDLLSLLAIPARDKATLPAGLGIGDLGIGSPRKFQREGSAGSHSTLDR
jgi:hypothetical protein